MSPRRRKLVRRSLWSLLILFVVMNGVAAMHAWRFTHFTDSKEARPVGPRNFTLREKIGMAFTGVKNPRPRNLDSPDRPYSRIQIRSDVHLDCWYLAAQTPNAKGTVIMFHGYGGDKSSLLERAYIVLNAGYNVLLPDFRGSGGSDGAQTSIGFHEARDVKACCKFIAEGGEKNIVLFGVSMGAAALLKHIHDGGPQPAGIIMECPYGTLYDAVCARFAVLHFPTVPMASLLTFWGGVEMGFNGFSLKPAAFAESVHCPALLIYGEKDDRVTMDETEAVYKGLGGPKTLRIYPEAGHANYLQQYKKEWADDVSAFLENATRPE